jgi:hypothetical protein
MRLKNIFTRFLKYIHNEKLLITKRSSISRFAPWTAFKSRLCGFAAQKYSTKPQLKSCRLARRYVGQEIKTQSFGKYEKAKALILKGRSFGFSGLKQCATELNVLKYFWFLR